MGLNRRRVVQLGTAATVGTMLPGLAAGQRGDFESNFNNALTQVRAKLAALGFDESPPLSIVTGDASYNGGMRHDFDQSALPSNSFVIQPLARVSDVDEKSRADVLPIFHEIGCHPAGADGQTTTRLMMRLLIDDFALDPSRIAFVSVSQAEDMRPALDEMGLPFTEKVLLRNEAEALAARDASGFFFPDPFGDDYIVTMGVYYRAGNTDEPAPKTYPPSANWTEIGEIVIGGDVTPLGISIGAERLVFALTDQYPTWEQRLDALFAQVKQENAAEPPGLSAFR